MNLWHRHEWEIQDARYVQRGEADRRDFAKYTFGYTVHLYRCTKCEKTYTSAVTGKSRHLEMIERLKGSTPNSELEKAKREIAQLQQYVGAMQQPNLYKSYQTGYTNPFPVTSTTTNITGGLQR